MEYIEKPENSKIEIPKEKITPWYLLELIKPVLADELIAKFRFDRTGIRIAFCNGQKFHLTIKEL
ncbi:MAG: hypothetical protein K2J54_04870 [Clostridia bacterium]|nr:hypothetical protein [Clostridia bacterium]MDE7256478.1 hypothetical protein [Clostridia bacterium]